jgi:hypothetical protein
MVSSLRNDCESIPSRLRNVAIAQQFRGDIAAFSQRFRSVFAAFSPRFRRDSATITQKFISNLAAIPKWLWRDYNAIERITEISKRL